MFEKVKEIVVETLNCDADKVTMEAKLSDDLGADSLDVVELNLAIEEAFQITIEEEALATIKTVGDIVAYLEKKAE